MDNDAKPKADLLTWVAWAHANQKRLIMVAVALAVVGAIAGIVVWRNNAAETAANDAIFLLPVPATVRPDDQAKVAAQYAQMAEAHAGTSASARALLIAGGLYFEAGDAAKAQGVFDRYMQSHADYPMTSQALLGLAACLEAEGKTSDAISRYEELIRTHPQDCVVPQAKSAVAQLYVANKQPDRALHYYDELARENSSWAGEAQIEAGKLLADNPSLRKPPPGSDTNMPMVSVPGQIR